jgi:AmmeMemoRadiSam system protein B
VIFHLNGYDFHQKKEGAMELRNTMFAGSWYPSQPVECEETIQRFLKDPFIPKDTPENVLGGVVPHAGWFFSGAIACHVIHAMIHADPPDTVVIFGMHLPLSAPGFIMTTGAWETPFGPIPIDTELAQGLTRRFAFKVETPDHHAPDNTIELQLPFVKYFFENARLLPIGVPPHPDALEIGTAVAELAEETGKRIRILGSTDLTHYGPNYGFTPKGVGSKALDWVKTENDRKFIDALLAMDPREVLSVAQSRQNACCAGAAATALAAVRAMGADDGRCLAYATSSDKSPGDSFVGYAGIVYHRTSSHPSCRI